MSGWFDAIGDKAIQKTGQYFKPGRYRVRIREVKKINGQKGEKFFVIETKVLESDNPEIQVGEERSQVVKMSNVMALINIKQFVAAASGVDPYLDKDDVNLLVEKFWKEYHPQGVQLPFAAIVDQFIVQANALEDVEMGLECVDVRTKEDGKFTKHIWEVRQG
jgi:hypothetical protein